MRDQRNIQLHQSFKPIANKLQQKWELKKKYLNINTQYLKII